MTRRVVVVGSVNMDAVLEVAALPRPGETVLATSLTYSPGGKGGNQAVAAARAGAAVRFVGAVGDDAAADGLLDHLRAEGVEVDDVTRRPGPSGTAFIVVDAGAENTIVVAPGANSELDVSSTDFADCDVLLVQLEIPVRAAVAAARAARGADVVVMVNASPGGQSGLAELAGLADVVVVNEREADQWSWKTDHLVVTRGARGADYRGADGEFEVPAPAVTAVDSTGAGDVFVAVLAAHWPDRSGPAAARRAALRRACAAGALATLVRGAGKCAPNAEEIERAEV